MYFYTPYAHGVIRLPFKTIPFLLRATTTQFIFNNSEYFIAYIISHAESE